jgi:hypothetical protein
MPRKTDDNLVRSSVFSEGVLPLLVERTLESEPQIGLVEYTNNNFYL